MKPSKTAFTVTASTPTGISGVNYDTPADVYNLQGHKVADGRTPSAKLPRGTYIVNGRKVVVK